MGLLQYRTIGQFLLFVCAAIGLYRGLKRWRIGRAIAKIPGKVVLVTGASSGLGEGTKGCGLMRACMHYDALCHYLQITAIARVLHSVGAKVILAGRNLQKLQQVKFTLDAETPGNVRV